MLKRVFDAILTGADDGPGCGIRLPFDPKEIFGKVRAPVRVNEHPAFRTTVASYGGVAWLGLRKDQRAAFGVSIGDRVRVRVERDDDNAAWVDAAKRQRTRQDRAQRAVGMLRAGIKTPT